MSQPVNGSPKVGRRSPGVIDRLPPMPPPVPVSRRRVVAKLADLPVRGPAFLPMPKGRPPDDEAKREVKVQIRAMATQRAAWHAAAALAGKDLSEWLRDLADEAARRTL